MTVIAQLGWLLPFGAGFGLAVICGFGLWLLQLYLDLRLTRAETERLAAVSENDALHARAWEVVEESRKRLRLRKSLNPEWIAPLFDEIPLMIREVAALYHPDADDPLKAPKLSEFTRAVQLTAADVSDFLQNRRIGRLVDLSANRALKTYEKGRKIAAKPKLRKAGAMIAKAYRRIRPVLQTVRFRSPITWAGIAVSNAAARALLPAVITIVGRRTIQLYSGELKLPTEPE